MNKGKQVRNASLIILGIVFLFAMACLALRLLAIHMQTIEISKVPEMTLERAQRLLEEVGGMNTVSHEAIILFARCKMKNQDYQILYPDDMKDTPAIALLLAKLERYSGEEYTGTGIHFNREGSRQYFLIKFGNHFMNRHIYIFDMDSGAKMNPLPSWIKVAENVFIEN